MCIKHNHRKRDKCLLNFLSFLNQKGIKTLASCCGHNLYPMTIVIDFKGYPYEIFSGTWIGRKRKFYKKDRQGYYYIPESVGESYCGRKFPKR